MRELHLFLFILTIGICSIISFSHAQQVPLGSWTVSSLDRSKGAMPYCTLARKFEENAILTFGQNTNDEYSFAIDFQKPKFDSEKPYKLSLQPGPGQIRAYESVPSNARAFVIRLGRDGSFFDALEDSKVLKIEIDGAQTAFSVNDLSQGLNNLDSCVAALQKSNIAPASGQEIEKITKEEVLTADAGESEQNFQASKVQAKENITNQPIEKTIKKNTVKPVALPKEQEAIATVSNISNKKLEAVEAQITDLRSENNRLKDALKQQRSEESSLSFESEKTISEMQERLAILEKENTTLEEKNIELDKQLIANQERRESIDNEQIAELERQLKRANKDNNLLSKKLEKTQQLQEENTVKPEDHWGWDLEQATKRYNEAEREIRRLGMLLEQERTSCTSEKANLETMLFDPAIAEREQISRLMSLEKQLNETKNDLNNQQKVSDQRVQEVAARLNEEKNQVEKQVSGLKKQLSDVTASVSQRESEIIELKSKSREVVGLNEKNRSLEEQVENLKSQVKEKQKQIISIKSTPQIDPKLVVENEALKAQLSQAQSQIKTVKEQSQELKQKIVSLEKQAVIDPKIEAENKVQKAQIARMVNDLKAKDAEISTLKVSANNEPNFVAENQGLKTEITNLKALKEGIQDKNILLKERLDKVQQQLVDIQSNQNQRSGNIASLELKNKQLEQQLSLKENESRTFQNQVKVLQQDLAQSKIKISQNNKSSSEVESLKREVVALNSKIIQMNSFNKKPTPIELNATTPQAGNVKPLSIRKAVEPINAIQPHVKTNDIVEKDIQKLLVEAGTSLQTNVSATSARYINSSKAYRWNAGPLKGYAEVLPLDNQIDFDKNIDTYISSLKKQCNGDFASVLSASVSERPQAKSYEIACVGSTKSQSASIIFLEKDNSFIGISHAVEAEDMDLAMDARDRLVQSIHGGRY